MVREMRRGNRRSVLKMEEDGQRMEVRDAVGGRAQAGDGGSQVAFFKKRGRVDREPKNRRMVKNEECSKKKNDLTYGFGKHGTFFSRPTLCIVFTAAIRS
jgi:hypothetical protein